MISKTKIQVLVLSFFLTFYILETRETLSEKPKEIQASSIYAKYIQSIMYRKYKPVYLFPSKKHPGDSDNQYGGYS